MEGPMRFDDPRNPAWIPKETIGCIERYVSSGLDPGDFLQAVLSNDLMEACKRADENNLKAIVAIAQHVYSNVPMNCHGTREIVKLWIELGSATRTNATADVVNKITEALYEALGRKGS
jgi:hypothetical protein